MQRKKVWVWCESKHLEASSNKHGHSAHLDVEREEEFLSVVVLELLLGRVQDRQVVVEAVLHVGHELRDERHGEFADDVALEADDRGRFVGLDHVLDRVEVQVRDPDQLVAGRVVEGVVDGREHGPVLVLVLRHLMSEVVERLPNEREAVEELGCVPVAVGHEVVHRVDEHPGARLVKK